MEKDIVYFDLETQRTANDAGGWDQKAKMGMSIGVTYSTKLGEYRIFQEKDVDALIKQLLGADLVVGFNLINFDYEVLMAYTIVDLPAQCRTLDLMVDIEKVLGHLRQCCNFYFAFVIFDRLNLLCQNTQTQK